MYQKGPYWGISRNDDRMFMPPRFMSRAPARNSFKVKPTKETYTGYILTMNCGFRVSIKNRTIGTKNWFLQSNQHAKVALKTNLSPPFWDSLIMQNYCHSWNLKIKQGLSDFLVDHCWIRYSKRKLTWGKHSLGFLNQVVH